MKGIEKIILDAVAVTGAAPLTDQQLTEVDLGSYPLAREFLLTGKTLGSGTAPGAARTVKVNWYWSDYKVALADVPTLLAARKESSAAEALTNAANAEQHWEFSGTLRPKARYLYVSFDQTAVDAGASLALTVNLVRVPSAAFSL